jgi:flagellar capping protein FliD
VTDIEQETVVNSMDIKSLSARMDRTNARHSEQFSEIKEMLKSLADKIDKLGHRRER